ncbi:MAG: M4 family metallopeptidase [Myxococcales bacterium]|nr:M4 family metallopeptidase [Myxococcales bacterium]
MKRFARLGFVAAAGLAVAACATSDDQAIGSAPVFHAGDAASVQLAEDLSLRQLLEVDPTLLRGVDGVWARGVEIDLLGRAHTRVAQSVGGVPVFGAEAIVHLDPTGKFLGMTDRLIRDVAVDPRPTLDTAAATAAAAATAPAAQGLRSVADLQILRHGDKDRLTYRVQLDYTQGGQPFRPVVFVDARTGAVVWSYDNLQTARNREVHNLNHGTALPGPLARTETGAASGDTDVDTNFARLGSTYDCYQGLFGRDSFDNAGAKLISSVHYSTNYVNAYWNGTQMVYGDGDNVNSRSLAISMDVTAHELTHAVTERTSNLIYAGESGGLNEAMSDIFGNVCEWYRDTSGDTGAPASANNWKVGEDIWLASPALRYMNDPALDGASLDYWTSTAGNVDVHYSSGIANLAFYLTAQGGTHPRGKSTTVVTGIGIYDAARVFYLANTANLTPSATFSDARAATVAAATSLFGAGSTQATQVGNAWTAVGVAAPANYQVIDTRAGLASSTSLSFSYPANGATAIKFEIAGGTGDADLYVKRGSAPTSTSYDCRPYTSGNTERCEFNPAQGGTYYVMIVAYATYSGVTLTVSAAGAAPTPETACADGLDNDGDGATDCADSDCAAAPACQAPTTETACADGLDNDGDGATDCADSDCAQAPACQAPATETACADGLDNDGDGATDCADSDCAQAPACQATWTTLASSAFESGWDGFVDGGADAARYRSTTYSASGRYSVQLRSASGAASSFWSPTLTVGSYGTLRIEYSALANSMEAGEDYVVELQRNGGAWTTVADLVVGADFSNGVRHAGAYEVPLAGASSVAVRFRVDASSRSDYVYFDDVAISAR